MHQSRLHLKKWAGGIPMHDTAFAIGKAFLSSYGGEGGNLVVDIGALDVNGSLRSGSASTNFYVGVDMDAGPSVDCVAFSATLPIASEVADLVVTSSCFEHDITFWQTFLEAIRILKPGGLLYISAPSNGFYHSYPVDNWRFYPDAGMALVRWAAQSGFPVILVESFIAGRSQDGWNDFVGVFQREGGAPVSADQLLHGQFGGKNVRTCFSSEVQAIQTSPDDFLIIDRLAAQISDLEQRLASNADAAARFDAATALLGRFSDERRAAEAEKAAVGEETRALGKSVRSLNRLLEKVRAELAARDAETEAARTEGKALADQLHALGQERDALVAQRQATEAEKSRMTEQIGALGLSLESERQELSSLRAEHVALQSAHDERALRLEEAVASGQAVKAALHAVKAEHDSLAALSLAGFVRRRYLRT